MSERWRKIVRAIGVALMVFGLAYLALPYMQNWIIDRNVAKQEQLFDQASADQLRKNKDSDASYDFSAIEAINPSTTVLNPGDIDPDLMLGNLYVPSVGISVVLFKGLSNDILNAGVGTMRPDQVMGEGNYPVAGHWSARDWVLFASLRYMEPGDKIYVTDKEKIYEYEMYDMKLVDAHEVWWIEDQVAQDHGSPIISLMNCHYVNNADTGQRRFVFGELKHVYDYKDAPKLDLNKGEKRRIKNSPRQKKDTSWVPELPDTTLPWHDFPWAA